MKLSVARLKIHKRRQVFAQNLADLWNLSPQQVVDATDLCRFKGRQANA